ncbi:MAG: transketolase C-terminal domain-containing protein, partial [Bacteroidota bacterium]
GPILLHVITEKGKGYAPAEQEATRLHGVTPFDKVTGKAPKSSAPAAYTKIFGEAMVDICREFPKVVGITAAMPDGTGLSILQKEMPERFFDVGIAEQHAVTFAAGMATEGYVPVTAIYSTFLQRAFDQVVHDVALQNLHVVFVLDRGGVVGADGPTHHGALDLSYLRCIQGMVVMAPKDEQELRDMLYTAVQHGRGPIALRYPRGNAIGVPLRKEFRALEVGKAETVRTGKDVALLAIGTMVDHADAAAGILEKEGITAEVVNMRFVKPLDENLLASIARRFDHVITIEDNVVQGGFGSAVLEVFARTGADRPAVLLHGHPDEFVDQGSPAELHRILKLDSQGIADITRRFLTARQGTKETEFVEP